VDSNAPVIVKEMLLASEVAGLGPMAAVAGAIAENVGKELLDYSPEIIVENGGDIFLKTNTNRLVGVYAGESPLTGKIALEIEPEETPMGICTSSGSVGQSLSLGRADAIVALSSNTALADACATAIGNLIQNEMDIDSGIEFAREISGLSGVLIIKGEKMGIWGKLKIVPVN
jgi:ApbE superfamily uncharacterized protein (UPF0280 family)